MHNRRYIGTYRPGRIGFIEEATIMKIGSEYACDILYRDYTNSRSVIAKQRHILNESLNGFKDTDLPFANISYLVYELENGRLLKQTDAEHVGIYRPGRIDHPYLQQPPFVFTRYETFIEIAQIYVDEKERICLKAKHRRYSPATAHFGDVFCYNRLLRYNITRDIFQDKSREVFVYNQDIRNSVRELLMDSGII